MQKQLLPAPTKSHYTFNLRDVSKVFQGMTKAGGALEASTTCIRLWVHEVLRVFADRLVDDADRLWLGRTLAELTERHFKEKLSSLLGLATTSVPAAAAAAPPAAPPAGVEADGAPAPAAALAAAPPAAAASRGVSDAALLTGLRGLIFGDFMAPASEGRAYCEIRDQGKMLHAVGEALADMNAGACVPPRGGVGTALPLIRPSQRRHTNLCPSRPLTGSKKPQKLVLFQFALEHVARISGIISQPGGHAMLVGLGGSGRQSLTRLAAYMQGMEVFQVCLVVCWNFEGRPKHDCWAAQVT